MKHPQKKIILAVSAILLGAGLSSEVYAVPGGPGGGAAPAPLPANPNAPKPPAPAAPGKFKAAATNLEAKEDLGPPSQARGWMTNAVAGDSATAKDYNSAMKQVRNAKSGFRNRAWKQECAESAGRDLAKGQNLERAACFDKKNNDMLRVFSETVSGSAALQTWQNLAILLLASDAAATDNELTKSYTIDLFRN